MNLSRLTISNVVGIIPQGYAREIAINADHVSDKPAKKKHHFSMMTSAALFNVPLERSGISGTIEFVNGIEQITAYKVQEGRCSKEYGRNAKADLVNLAKYMEIGITNKVMLNLEAGLSSYSPEQDTAFGMEM